jgi:hypothetical protein
MVGVHTANCFAVLFTQIWISFDGYQNIFCCRRDHIPPRICLNVFYLKAVSVSDFNFPGDNLTVALGPKLLKAHKAATFAHNMAISFFDGALLSIEILVHFFEEIQVISC